MQKHVLFIIWRAITQTTWIDHKIRNLITKKVYKSNANVIDIRIVYFIVLCEKENRTKASEMYEFFFSDDKQIWKFEN